MNDDAQDAASGMPEASFLNFLSGLGSQCLMQLGKIPNPHSGQREENLPFARYTVDLLRILQEKSAGNRTPDEDRYLTGLLQDLEHQLQQADNDG